MKNEIEKTIILCNNSTLEKNEKEIIKNEIINAIKKHKCYVFDYSDGENLIPIFDYSDLDYAKMNIYIPSTNYEIPTDFYQKNKYLIENKNCLELLNKCDGKGYKLENIIEMNRYLFDFDFDENINLDDAIKQIKNIIIDYDLPVRLVFTGRRGAHLVFLSNKVSNINEYIKVWNEILNMLNIIIPTEISDYIDINTNRPNLYTRLPNANRNETIQTLIYDNLKYYKIILLDTQHTQHTQYTKHTKYTQQAQHAHKKYDNFDLQRFYKYSKNNNVRIFLDGNAKIGERTDIGVSAIASIKKAMEKNECSKFEINNLIKELTIKYCQQTGAKIQHFATILKN
jgi:hypothetical protein